MGGGAKDIRFLWLVFIIVFQRELCDPISLKLGYDSYRKHLVGRSEDPLCQVVLFMMRKTIRFKL